MKSVYRIFAVLVIMLVFSSAGVSGDSVLRKGEAKRPLLIVGDDINYPPYSYLDQNGEPAGFNVELARFVGTAMGYDVEIRLDEWDKTRLALEAGEIDVISGMFYSTEREKTYSFSSKHSITSGAIFTDRNIALKDLQDLSGKTIVVQKGDIVGEYLAQQNLGVQLVEVGTVSEAISLISDGTYDYAGLLKLPGLYTIKEKNLKHIQAQELVLMSNDYSMAVKRGNEDLLLLLNGGLQIAKATGDYQRIYESWLGIYEDKDMIQIVKAYSWIIYMTLGIVSFLFLWGISSRHLVHVKTRELQSANRFLQEQQEELTASHEEMEASLEELLAIEEELREQHDRLLISEGRLKISEQRNRAIISALPDILFVLDKDGRFLDSQAGNESELLMPREAFVGKLLDEVLPPEIAKVGHEKIRSALETGELQSFDYELMLGDQRAVFELRITRSQDDEVVGITRNITEQKNYQERIEYLSYHDQLTSLYNRRFFEEELGRLDVPRNLPLCIIMADVNGLKLINDSFGHHKGDELLIKVGHVLKQACRADEIICRIGGDEFVIILPNMETDQAEDLIKRIKGISDQESVASLNLSISFGWEAKRHAEEDIHEVFNRAEDFMYKKKLFEGPSMRGKTIGAIINTLHEKNRREEQHSQRVACLSKELASFMNLSERDIEEINNAGLLHDIGKIAIHEYLLNKEGKLTDEEFEEVRRHPEIGYRILSSVNDMSDMAEYVLSHHERWDGKGYPRGLAGEAIPLQSRMIAIADAFDAMTSERSYRSPMTEEAAAEELLKHAGTQFDPVLVRRFVENVLKNPAVTDCG